jgi:rare lipoprotein A
MLSKIALRRSKVAGSAEISSTESGCETQHLPSSKLHRWFDLGSSCRDNNRMKRERTTSQPDRERFLSSRSSDLIRACAVRVALVATVFGCTASAIAGGHGKTDKAATVAAATSNQKLSAASRVKQWLQTGQASWYGLKFQGRKTATGESYDMNALTCAHRSLPLGSWLRVTNLSNRKSILVRVNDRGPMVRSRIVDLSYAAARAVDLAGTGKVKLERVDISDPEVVRTFVAQLSSMPEFPQLLPAQ